MSQQAAKRRRSQARNGYAHIAPLLRPHYKKRDAQTAARRLVHLIERERRMSANKGKRKAN